MKKVFEFIDDGINMIFPVCNEHIKSTISYLLSERKMVSKQSIKEALPWLFFSHGYLFYQNHTLGQQKFEEAEEYFKMLFPDQILDFMEQQDKPEDENGATLCRDK